MLWLAGASFDNHPDLLDTVFGKLARALPSRLQSALSDIWALQKRLKVADGPDVVACADIAITATTAEGELSERAMAQRNT